MNKARQDVIDGFKREFARNLAELDKIDDLDLYEEMAGKMHDVLLTYRQATAAPMSDAQLAELAFQAYWEEMARSRQLSRDVAVVESMPWIHHNVFRGESGA